MSRRLVLMRHGRTSWNVLRRAQGHTDIELDEVGHAQAAVAGPWVATEFTPSLVWSSDLRRASQTASYVAACLDLEVVADARLREFDLGERTGASLAEYALDHPTEYAALQAGDFSVVPGAETPEDVAARLLPALGEAVAQLGEDATGLVVSHGSAIKVGVLGLLGLPLDVGVLRSMDNCTVAVLHQVSTAPGWRLVGYGISKQDPDFATGPRSG